LSVTGADLLVVAVGTGASSEAEDILAESCSSCSSLLEEELSQER
jgi:hypothetical protein